MAVLIFSTGQHLAMRASELCCMRTFRMTQNQTQEDIYTNHPLVDPKEDLQGPWYCCQ